MFSANLAHDLKKENILVAMIHPGCVATSMGLNSIPDPDKDKDPRMYSKTIVLSFRACTLGK